MMFILKGTKKLSTALFAALVLCSVQEGEAQGASSTSIRIQKEISVAAGETLTLDKRKLVNLVLETLTLEDNAVVRLAPGTDTLFIRAKHARIGEGVRIEGTGSVGKPKPTQPQRPEKKKMKGHTGHTGNTGGDGPTIVLVFESHQIGGLTVQSQGGRGGSGGQGGKGSRASQGKCGRSAIDAGHGGNGGKGGTGGRGGNVFVMLLDKESKELPQELHAISQPGVGGERGKGGSWIPGAPKYCCGWLCRPKRGPALPGNEGPKGEPGEEGSVAGKTEVYLASQDPGFVTTEERLGNLMGLLQENGYAGNADALQAVLDSGALWIQYAFKR